MSVEEGSWYIDTLCYSSMQKPMVWMGWMPWTQPHMLIKVVIMMTQMRTSWNSFSRELGRKWMVEPQYLLHPCGSNLEE